MTKELPYTSSIKDMPLMFTEMKRTALLLSEGKNQRIELYIDDGVKVNYTKFQGVEVPKDDGKTETMDLLARI